MAKWCGKIGFRETYETERSGIYDERITERIYYGDVIRNSRRLQQTNVISDLNISNQISIVADPYAFESFHNIVYAEFRGAKWNISDIEVEYPRLMLTLGGIYNG